MALQTGSGRPIRFSRLWRAFTRLLPLLTHPSEKNDHHFVIRHTFVGGKAIAAFIKEGAIEARARAGARSRDPGPGFVAKPRLALRMGQLAWTAIDVGGWAYFSYAQWMSDRPVWAVGSAGIASLTALVNLIPAVRLLINELANRRVLAEYAAGTVTADIPTENQFVPDPGDLLKRFIDFMESKHQNRDDFLYIRNDIALPLSLSAAPIRYSKRIAPSADQIAQAARLVGSGPRPRDARVLRFEFIFGFDHELNKPVLMVFARELKAALDWMFW